MSTVILEYLTVLLSAPPVVAVLILIGMSRFSDDIRDLLSRVAMIRLPGGAEVATQQSRGIVDEERTTTPNPEEIPVRGLPLGLTPAQQQEIASLIRSHIANAHLWEYRYLNFFLARSTQVALDWLIGIAEPITIGHYDSWFLAVVPSARERKAMIAALETHHLIQLEDGTKTISVTPKGREYHQWRGALPPLPNTATGTP